MSFDNTKISGRKTSLPTKEYGRLLARIEALEGALESVSGFCLLYEAGNLGGAETVRRIHGVTDHTLLSTTEPDHGHA